jgi:hypothetical protein
MNFSGVGLSVSSTQKRNVYMIFSLDMKKLIQTKVQKILPPP